MSDANAKPDQKQVPLQHAILAALVLFAGGGGAGTALAGGVGKQEFDRVVLKLDQVLSDVGDLRVKLAESGAGTTAWRRDVERRLEQLEKTGK